MNFLKLFFINIFFCFSVFSFSSINLNDNKSLFYCHENLNDIEKDIDEKPIERFNKIKIKIFKQTFKDIINKKDSIKHQKTNYSPNKKASYSLDSPIKCILKPKIKLYLNESKTWINSNIIYSNIYKFDTGVWIFLDPLRLNDTIAIDCDNLFWESFIKNNIKKINFDEQETFIIDIINIIYENLDKLERLLTYNTEDDLLCRHFATLSLAVFSKIFSSPASLFKGRIQQITGDFLDDKWLSHSAHTWNLLTIIDASQKETFWLLDTLKNSFINLSSSPSLDQLIMYTIYKKKKVIKISLNQNEEYSDYARLTKEKFDITPLKKDNLSKDLNRQELAATKMMINYKLPNKSSYNITKIDEY